MRLAEVGEAGQAKLSAAEVTLRSEGFARTMEEAYLRAAGVGIGRDERLAGGAPADLGLRHEAAREVADGAYAALVAMRQVLG